MKTIPMPRFTYIFLRRPYHSRAIAAWAILRLAGAGKPVAVEGATTLLASIFGVTPKAIRDMRRHPKAGTFWTERGGLLHLKKPEELWELVRTESAVAVEQYMNVPVKVFRKLATMKAWIAQSILSRGTRPCSIAFSAKMLQCGRRIITDYRRILAAADLLYAYAQYEDRGELKTTGTLKQVHVPQGREFISHGRIRQRLPDIVLLRDREGEIIDILANEDIAGKKRRRYYGDERSVGEGASAESLVRVSGNTWANVFRADRGAISTILNVVGNMLNPSPRGKRSRPVLSHVSDGSDGAGERGIMNPRRIKRQGS